MKLPGRLTITRSGDEMRIQVEDESSGVTACEVRISLEEMMSALTAHAYRPCRVEWRVANMGKVSERKTEMVKWAQGQDVEKALRPYCVDGWTPRAGDLGNKHRRNGDSYAVTFFRHVDPK